MFEAIQIRHEATKCSNVASEPFEHPKGPPHGITNICRVVFGDVSIFVLLAKHRNFVTKMASCDAVLSTRCRGERS